MTGLPAAPITVPSVTALGLAVGSFLNVVIYRLPHGSSLVSPPSRCPVCEVPIRAWQNVPVLGWLALRGRCANCRTRISPRYPIVEVMTAMAFVALAVRLAGIGLAAAIPAYLYFAAIGIALTMIDLDLHRLPDAIVLPSYPVVACLLLCSAIAQHDLSALVRAGLGALGLFSAYFALAFAYPDGMGFGDVKLSGLLGGLLAYLSWPTLIVGAAGAFVLGGVVGGAMILLQHGTRKTAIPYGPFMIASTFGAIFWGNSIWKAYIHVTLSS